MRGPTPICVLLWLAAGSISCTAPTEPAPSRKSSVAQSVKEAPGALACEADIVSGELRVRFRFTNERDEPVWVPLSLPVASGPGLRQSGTAAYVRPVAGGAAIVRAYAEVPDGLDVEQPERPHWQRLEPRESLSGEMVVAWPLKARHPYLQEKLSTTGYDAVLECHVGWVAGAERPRDPNNQRIAVGVVTID